MPEYIAGLCVMEGTELVPLETHNITATDDEEAVRIALEWRVNAITTAPLDRRMWLQVLHDGEAVFSKEIGQL